MPTMYIHQSQWWSIHGSRTVSGFLDTTRILRVQSTSHQRPCFLLLSPKHRESNRGYHKAESFQHNKTNKQNIDGQRTPCSSRFEEITKGLSLNIKCKTKSILFTNIVLKCFGMTNIFLQIYKTIWNYSKLARCQAGWQDLLQNSPSSPIRPLIFW